MSNAQQAKDLLETILAWRQAGIGPNREISRRLVEIKKLGGLRIPEIQQMLEDPKYPTAIRRTIKDILKTTFCELTPEGDQLKVAV